jgi:hypothetical protein
MPVLPAHTKVVWRYSLRRRTGANPIEAPNEPGAVRNMLYVRITDRSSL